MNIISSTFDSSIMPYVYDFFKLMLKIGMVQGAFYVMKMDKKMGIDKVKYAVIGYTMLKFTDVFIKIIDQIAINAIR